MSIAALKDALKSIGSSSIKERTEGLSTLKNVLRSHRSQTQPDDFDDALFSEIYSVLFATIRSETSTYSKTKTATTRTAAANRLSAISSAVQQSVQAGASVIRSKTVKAVLDEVLPPICLGTEAFSEPVALDYARSFRAILAHQAHLTHLSTAKWEQLLDLAIDCVQRAEQEDRNDGSTSGADRTSATPAMTLMSYRSSRSVTKAVSDSQDFRSSSLFLQEMIVCVRLLVLPSNAPVGRRLSHVIWTLIEVLRSSARSSANASSLRVNAFSAINSILQWCRTDNINLTRAVTPHMIRLTANFWSTKVPALADAQLSTLILLRPYIDDAANNAQAPVFRPEVENLVKSIRTEHSKRGLDPKHQGQLGLDDLRFDFQSRSGERGGRVEAPLFSLRCAGPRAEQHWFILESLASLSSSLIDQHVEDHSDLASDDGIDEDLNHRPRKRQRLEAGFESLIFPSAQESGTIMDRLFDLQALAFLVQRKSFTAQHLSLIVERVTTICSEELSRLSPWAFLTLATCASQTTANSPLLASKWSAVWQLANRALSSPSSCRTASLALCILLKLRLIPQSSIVELTSTLTNTMDLSGPAVLADSVVLLLAAIQQETQQNNPGSALLTAESIIRWWTRMYVPSRYDDRVFANTAAVYDVSDITLLVGSCLNKTFSVFPAMPFPVWEDVSKMWIHCSTQQDAISYLLLQPTPASCVNTELFSQPRTLSGTSRLSCEALILTHSISELAQINDTWPRNADGYMKNIGVDALILLCKTACLTASLACGADFRDSKRQTQLQKQAQVLLKSLASFVSHPGCEVTKRDALIFTFSTMLPGFEPLEHPDVHRSSQFEKLLCQTISEIYTSIQGQKESINDTEEDMMDVDSHAESQDSLQGSRSSVASRVTEELAMTFSKSEFRACIFCYANAVTMSTDESSVDSVPQAMSESMVNVVLAQSVEAILASRKALVTLSRFGLVLDALGVERLLDFFMEVVLGSYNFNRSEVAIGTVIDVLSSFISVWTDPANSKLRDLGIELYEWFTNVALPNDLLSPKLQQKLANLLLQLCHIDTGFASNSEAPSVRTTLFSLLQTGTISLQHYLSGRISSLFGHFVLSAHSAMFSDLESSLPTDPEWVEGMAMRLVFLSKLAAAWQSLLRQCIYHIFDAAGRVKASLGHATHCIRDLALQLPIKSPRKLFTLFAPQLLHTWLETQPLAGLPYSAFEYASVLELFRWNQQEICAQLVMRGDEDGLAIMSQEMKIASKDLIRQSFAKCVAYSISRDVCTPQSPSNPTPAESRLRTLLGNRDDFKRYLSQQFATILGQFYLSMHQDDVMDSWLDKRPAYAAASQALKEITIYSRSDRKLPEAQEPFFRSKYLCDQIERLCRRMSVHSIQPWDSSSFTLAVRMLFDSMDESLGSLHTCLLIRNLRVLISMGGDVALTGFPLEMLIFSLRPFLNDSECADDVLGILHYLFTKGQEYLNSNSNFLGGTIIMLVLQMRMYSRTQQDSTTQESQHHATVQKMIDFQGWLVKYLATTTQGLPSIGYNMLTDALRNLTLPGNARQGSPESKLLLFLLEQLSADEPLCSRSDCLEALDLLSERFEMPESLAEDCLLKDDDAVKYADPLWYLLQMSQMSPGFTFWAAQALGRAYASTGVTPRRVSHSRTEKYLEDQSVQSVGTLNSQQVISENLCSILYSKDRHEAGLAEYTLRRIAISFSDAENALTFGNMLPPIVDSAVQPGNCGYRPNVADNMEAAPAHQEALRKALDFTPATSLERWTTNFAVSICNWASKLPILPALTVIMQQIHGLAQKLLPCIVHISLASEVDKGAILRAELSAIAVRYLAETEPVYFPVQRVFLELLTYLRSQPIPGEVTRIDRLRWLDIDLLLAANAAVRCGMPTTALFLAESDQSQPAGGRRATSRNSLSQSHSATVPDHLLHAIYKQIDEPDSFYGIQQSASLQSIIERLDHESDGFRSLMFRSAQMDSHMRQSHQMANTDAAGLTTSLSTLDLHSLSFALLSRGVGDLPSTSANMLTAARTLQQWDVSLPENVPGEDTVTFSIFQELSHAVSLDHVQASLRSAMIRHVRHDQAKNLTEPGSGPSSSWFGTLAALAELGEIISSRDHSIFRATWSSMQSREGWMQMSRYDQVSPIISNRQTLFGVLSQNVQVQKALRLSQKQCRAAEIECLLGAARLAREHARLQVALAAVSSLNDMMEECKQVGLDVEAAIKFETASVLWDSEEGSASVRMLRDILAIPKSQTQYIPVGEPGLLAQLGHQLALAKLERPEDILEKYLTPAFSQLKDRREGAEAGKVFYEFASFCDSELFDPGRIESFDRISRLREQKANEVNDLRIAIKAEKRADQKRDMQRSLNKAQQWYNIDDSEWQRLKQSRDIYMQQSLRSYLLTLAASDKHDMCVLRFFALWLENADESAANKIVSKYLAQVPSWKFVLLMNQLMSRLEDDNTPFQGTLKAMVMRLCLDHPYHSMHHLFAAHRKPMNPDDDAAISRYTAAQGIVLQLRDNRKRGELLNSMFLADRCYDGLAQAQAGLRENSNKINTKDLPKAMKVALTVPPLRIPPITVSLSLRPDCDYSSAPTVTKFGTSLSVLGGLSAPKLLTVHATDGQQYKQIFKSGNDDLRQDAIMEQVFEEVSKMLRSHKATRQRDLKVRTYKVVPLSSTAGVIEFVAHSLPLGEFLRPAHARYHPADYRDSKARDMIRAADSHSPDTRIAAFRKVCEHVQPVLRHFFLERFAAAPDAWFARRTAYTRTTAAISILGYVLGLGDRHCQNILLDERSGDVVHIDLGVAFEAGRVLPIPELVPFRLTRDIVDGMGATRTEGVFRRCCEFTVDALRANRAGIMTLLNVLRYDPLYTWTMSPLRARRMQEAQDAAAAAAAAAAAGRQGEGGAGNPAAPAGAAPTSSRKRGQEAGEAERALSIVEKKLATTLSTAATVNELIQQATDERHLAMLFGGWAAYF